VERPVIAEDQTEVVAFLESPITHGGKPVVRIDTHASIVFLAGERAWKLKRAVRYDYLDFSTVERRRAMCEAEIRVNRRVGPALYRRAVPVTREATGRLALGGRGIPIEWLVEMVRFDQEGLFDRLAARKALDLALMRPLATTIAHFHDAAERRADHGGMAGMSWVVEGNATGFAEQGAPSSTGRSVPI
jgi:aminoglycoside phosphotransferase family enzyme